MSHSPIELENIQRDLLSALGDIPEAAAFTIGGGVALNTFVEPRVTNDIDAWWTNARKSDALIQARGACERVGADYGLHVQTRSAGDVESIEFLSDDNKKVFSFQVASRDVSLDAPDASPWGQLKIESLTDNVASKMVALVKRGAPRDFADIKRVVDAGLASVDDLWVLWQRKQPGQSVQTAKAHVMSHLVGIENRTPLNRVPEEELEQRSRARVWIRETLLCVDIDRPRLRGFER